MALWKEMVNRLRYLASRRRFDAGLDDEVQFHLETRAAELEASGLSAREALARARREFGSLSNMREDTRAAWQFRWLEELAADLRYASRAFARNPAFASTAILCLALGIGANTTMFSLANELLFTTASVGHPQSLIHIQLGGNSHVPLREYRFIRDARLFEGIAGEHEESEANWQHSGATDRLFVVQVTDNFFAVTGIPLAMGRPIAADTPAAVVLSYGFWQRRLGADPKVLGRNLILDGKPFTVAGVLPRDHRTVTGFGFSPDLYMPVSGENAIVALFARMPQGMTRPIARERLKAASQELDRVLPDGGGHKWANQISVEGVMGLDNFRPNVVPVVGTLGLLMTVVGLVLLIACANVASLLLARASSRTQEIAIRISIGAGRGRIVRQLLAETLLLAIGGTASGLGLNFALTSLLSRFQLPLPVPIRFVIDPDWRLLAYAIAVSFACTLAAGLMPALKGTRAGLGAALKRSEHQGHRHFTLRNSLVVGQLAASIVLLCAGFVFMRNLVRSASMSPGFDAGHAVWASMRLVPERYPKSAQQRAVAEAALERLRALPGIEAASVARVVPLNGNDHIATNITVAGSAQPVFLRFQDNFVSSGYFRAMDIPMVQGREFLPSDRAGSTRVVILNETMARRLFGSVNPAGQTIEFYGGPAEVVGVAKNSKYFLLNEENQAASYEPYSQLQRSTVNLNFLLRTSAPETQIRSINAALGQIDPTAALETKPMSDALAFAMLPSRIGAGILGSMGALGLLLAAIGLYGTLLYAVSRRIREIGLRVALGATPAAVLQLVLRQSAGLVALGLAIGIALAVFAVRPLAAFLLPDIHPADPANFLAGAGVLCVVALVATIAPALRALRVSPVVALRHE